MGFVSLKSLITRMKRKGRKALESEYSCKRKFRETKVRWSENTKDRKFHGAVECWNFRSWEWIGRGAEKHVSVKALHLPGQVRRLETACQQRRQDDCYSSCSLASLDAIESRPAASHGARSCRRRPEERSARGRRPTGQPPPGAERQLGCRQWLACPCSPTDHCQ